MADETDCPHAKPAAPTIPPPEPVDITTQITKRIEWWKVVIGAVVFIFAAGVSFAAWTAHYVSREDADRMHANLDNSIVSLSTATNNTIGRIASEMTQLRERVAKSEATIDWMARTLYDMSRQMGVHATPPPAQRP